MINSLARAAAAGTFVILAGCSSLLAPQPDRSKFFVLSAAAASAPPAASAAGALSIGLGPVRLPPYLSGREEIATRAAPNQIEYSATDRWAEPLDTNFSRVLGKDISDSLGNVQIVTYPWFRSTPIDYKIEVDTERFERAQDGDSELSAHWTIRDGRSDEVLLARQSSIHHGAQAKGGEASVAALSADVTDLGDQIATALRGLQEGRSHRARKPGAGP